MNEIATVIPMASSRRARDAEQLLRLYLAEAVAPYAPVQIDVRGELSILISPIVEPYRGELVLLDGMHRCLAALREGLDSITVAVARPEHAPPPAGPRLALGEVLYSPPAEDPPPVFDGRGYANYRPGALFVAAAVELLTQGSCPFATRKDQSRVR
ncbi:hypothetical protein [Micromonospora sp. NBC_00617]|uniref:hypothetical protein n=1 Tax=Micromonospora sp. NBC_00617 TaxID=2903587 RepID=UPI0030E49223